MADWKNIESYANQIVNKAVPEKDRHKAAENIFFLAAELACAADGPSREGLGWDGSWGIITRDLKEAEAVAGFFDKVFGERVCVTGEWNGCTNKSLVTSLAIPHMVRDISQCVNI